VDEVTAWSVGAETARVKRPTELRLVARMTVDRAQLADAVRELALGAVAARPAGLGVRPTQLGLVARRRVRGAGTGGGGRRGTVVMRGRTASPTSA